MLFFRALLRFSSGSSEEASGQVREYRVLEVLRMGFFGGKNKELSLIFTPAGEEMSALL